MLIEMLKQIENVPKHSITMQGSVYRPDVIQKWLWTDEESVISQE